MRRSLVALIAVAAGAFAAGAYASADPGGGVIWVAGAEHPLVDEWAAGNAADVDAGRGTSTQVQAWQGSTFVRQVTSPVAEGSRAYAFTVDPRSRDPYTHAAQRSELGQNNPARGMVDGVDRQMHQGEERWIAFQIWIPSSFQESEWDAIQQNKAAGKGNGPLSWYFED